MYPRQRSFFCPDRENKYVVLYSIYLNLLAIVLKEPDYAFTIRNNEIVLLRLVGGQIPLQTLTSLRSGQVVQRFDQHTLSEMSHSSPVPTTDAIYTQGGRLLSFF